MRQEKYHKAGTQILTTGIFWKVETIIINFPIHIVILFCKTRSSYF